MIALRAVFSDQGWAWHLRHGDTVEAWRGTELVADIPAALIAELVDRNLPELIERSRHLGAFTKRADPPRLGPNLRARNGKPLRGIR